MSDSIRIALVAEGPTDYIVLKSVLNSILTNQSFKLTLLQPEFSVAFDRDGNFGTGWGGVYQWCRQSVKRNKHVSKDILFYSYDLLIIQIDADVAGKSYSDANIHNQDIDLPCEKACPPPCNTINELRKVVLKWMNEISLDRKIVFCFPSKSMEAWVIKALFPNDTQMSRCDWECYPNPESRFVQQPKKIRIRKSQKDYESQQTKIQSRWPLIVQRLSQAKRFNDELRQAITGVM